MSRTRFVVAARAEFLAKIDFYSEAQPGLGKRFAAAVEEAVMRALVFPEAGSPFQAETRRVMVRGISFFGGLSCRCA